ncbi:MAG: hypothetical protein M5U34_39410 [Chloroflexi bacterium]|nr:hypothetical protein [Chloroflexota bacterium]
MHHQTNHHDKNHLAHHKWEILGLTAVLLLAAFLRLGFPGINSFGFDEARVSHMALQMARGGSVCPDGHAIFPPPCPISRRPSGFCPALLADA